MPRSAKNPLLKKSATQNERDFRVDFYAEDAIRLSPYKDDKWKYAENTPFWAGSDYSRLPTEALAGMLIDEFTNKDGHDPEKVVKYLSLVLKSSLPAIFSTAAEAALWRGLLPRSAGKMSRSDKMGPPLSVAGKTAGFDWGIVTS